MSQETILLIAEGNPEYNELAIGVTNEKVEIILRRTPENPRKNYTFDRLAKKLFVDNIEGNYQDMANYRNILNSYEKSKKKVNLVYKPKKGDL